MRFGKTARIVKLALVAVLVLLSRRPKAVDPAQADAAALDHRPQVGWVTPR